MYIDVDVSERPVVHSAADPLSALSYHVVQVGLDSAFGCFAVDCIGSSTSVSVERKRCACNCSLSWTPVQGLRARAQGWG